MSDNCPVCQTACGKLSEEGKGFGYECPRCGNFVLSHVDKHRLKVMFSSEREKKEEISALLSHAIRKMQKHNEWAPLSQELIQTIVKGSLPKPAEQKDIFIRWVGDNINALGDYIQVKSPEILAIIGARTEKEFFALLPHLKESGIVQSKPVVGGGSAALCYVTLSFSGWEYYEELKRGETES